MSDPSGTFFERIVARWSAASPVPPLVLQQEASAPYAGVALLRLARCYAAGLQSLGVARGDRVALILPTCEAFLGTVFGAWWLGAAVVPLAPPSERHREDAARLGRALATARPRLTVVDPRLAGFFGQPGVAIATPDQLSGSGEHSAAPAPLDLALIQFSSGSTGHPKGVMLHATQLEANLEAIQQVVQATPEEHGVSWLPLHHDMGLIGSLLYSQWAGMPLLLMPPEAFIRQPLRWIKAMSDHQATMTVAPNFAYQLCSRLPAASLEGLDLSRWRVAMVGAEPVRAQAMQDFAARMAPCGFRDQAIMPTYGLAEAVLAVAMTPRDAGLRHERIRQDHFESEHRALRAAGDAPSREAISVGRPVPGTTVVIRDEAGQELPDRSVGEVWVRSPSVMAGYFGNPEATAEALCDGMLRTGDLGYLAEGELYIAGRLKDVIIRGGAKYHPQDLEAIAEAHPAARMGGAAAFAVVGESERTERVVMIVETRLSEPDSNVREAIRMQIFEATGLRMDDVRLVPAHQLPKTTSGKIRRSEARQRYLAGAYDPAHA